LIPPEATNVGITDTNGNPWTGSDVIRTFVPAVGDYRLPAARYNVPSTMWMRHPLWQAVDSLPPLQQPRSIHTFTTHVTTTEPGCILPSSTAMARFPSLGLNKNQQLVAGAPYSDGRIPDLPPDNGWAATANAYGDYDNGIANARDGAYVNKPDEGNFYAGNFTRYNSVQFYRSGYFYEPWHNSDDWRTGIYMTPNRIVSSPVMFGSLPTGVWSGGSVGTSAISGGVSYSEGKPWQTLLFRPHASSNSNYGRGVSPGHPGDNNPRDHYLLDLFFMPVVEPYAISEPLSTAGRINLNYQIVPFTNITRATGMHAVMKGEFMTTIPLGDTDNAKNYQTAATSSMWSNSGDRFWDESTNQKYWHRPIDVTKTLYQFDQKFQHSATGTNHALNRFRGLFRSPSQICEIHLIPDVSNGPSSGGETLGSISNINANTSGTNLQSVMEQFWQSHPGTGDNTRERPYSNIYARVTTRSNTFRVHMRAQVITKARSTAADTMDPTKDAVLGEYRGSALIERYIDPTDVANPLPDYGATPNPLGEKPLDTYYKFRTLESKRFSP
ncbi:MAG: Verru_Chthon cassette protein A, partial [Verrucomicrobia bacterium]|nr:Verru_Chthon cassette protein A [Verrucomicrobiota bacterium]